MSTLNIINESFARFLNLVTPSGHTYVNIDELSKAIGNEINTTLNERLPELKEVFEDLKISNDYTTEIVVATEKEKEWVLKQNWFNENSISIEKDKKRIMEGITTSITLNSSLNYRELDNSQNQLTKDACYARLRTDPIFQNAITNLTSYAVGHGGYYNSVVPEIKDVIDNLYYINNFENETSLALRVAFRYFLEGDVFLLGTVDPVNGNVYYNFIETYEIESWEVNKNNREQVLAYKINNGSGFNKWVAHYNYFDGIYNSRNPMIKQTSANHTDLSETQFIVHLKDTLLPEFFSRPLSTPALRYYKYAEDFIKDRVILNHERSRILLKRTIKGKARGAQLGKKTLPPSGQILNATDDVDYDFMSAKIGADDVKQDFMNIMYNLCAAYNMPIVVLGLRADEQVYASALSAKAPFTKSLEVKQDSLSNKMILLYRIQIREKHKRDILPDTVSVSTIENDKRTTKKVDIRKAPISHVFPSPVDEAVNEKTQFYKAATEYNWISLRSIREREGYDANEEKLRIEEEAKERSEMTVIKMRKQPTSKADATVKQQADDANRAGK